MTDAPERIVACPTCRKPVHWSPTNRFRPFCSKRCQLIDLGAWASEDYRIPAEDVDLDAEVPDDKAD
jgi:endogenous inhibitor of DNA gyrase (YacG/DUF329 family)